MKSFEFKFSAIGCLSLFIIGATSVSSCKKDQTCHGYVNVYDTAGLKVAGATVRLDANAVGGQKTYTATTDGSGLATFDIDLPAIFDVTASKATFPGMYGKGSLNVDEPQKDGWVTVKLNY